MEAWLEPRLLLVVRGRLLVDEGRCGGQRFKSLDRDGLPRDLTHPVGAGIDSGERSLDAPQQLAIKVVVVNRTPPLKYRLGFVALVAGLLVTGALELVCARLNPRFHRRTLLQEPFAETFEIFWRQHAEYPTFF